MPPYRFDVISLAPKAFDTFPEYGVIGRALTERIAELNIFNPRDFASDSYRKVDDEPYGGGVGMVLKPEPIFSAFESIPVHKRRRVIILSPQGKKLSQEDFHRWSLDSDQLVLICGQYEGFDERIRTLADEEISIGDFVLTGGELPAMTIINGVLRLLPGTLGTSASLEEESHADFLLEHPQYTRPKEFRGMKVPEVLRSGDHAAIANWRKDQSEKRTKERRPDIYKSWSKKQASDSCKIDSVKSSSVQIRINNQCDLPDPWFVD